MDEQHRVSRRQVLRGGVVVGAAVYAAPVVQVLTMTAASAQVASGGQPPGGAPVPPPRTPVEVLPNAIDRPSRGPAGAAAGGPGSTPVLDARAGGGSSGALPFSGAEVGGLVAVGTAAVAAGAALSVGARRRTAVEASGAGSTEAAPPQDDGR